MQIAPCQLFQRNIPDTRRDVQFDTAPVVFRSRESQVRLCVELVPRLQPCAERVFVRSPYIDAFRFRDCLCQLLFYLCLRLAENALDDSLSDLFVVPCRVSALPAPIFALSDISFSVCPFLCYTLTELPADNVDRKAVDCFFQISRLHSALCIKADAVCYRFKAAALQLE